MAAQERGTEAVGVPFSASRSVEATRCHTHASASNRPILDNDRSPSLDLDLSRLFSVSDCTSPRVPTPRASLSTIFRARARA